MKAQLVKVELVKVELVKVELVKAQLVKAQLVSVRQEEGLQAQTRDGPRRVRAQGRR
ncbi:hypothetical protein [Massilia sp. TWP1-3-3]|uniref:hypothetical protein n=1 Tax=Massilia sp. TWP1-3-3 TaxID=2804573 RepID=UPI003CE89734